MKGKIVSRSTYNFCKIVRDIINNDFVDNTNVDIFLKLTRKIQSYIDDGDKLVKLNELTAEDKSAIATGLMIKLLDYIEYNKNTLKTIERLIKSKQLSKSTNEAMTAFIINQGMTLDSVNMTYEELINYLQKEVK